MKKIFARAFIPVVIIISFSMYKGLNQKVEYEVLNFAELPEQIQNEISISSEKNGFTILNDKKYTYVFYRANHKENEYISTELNAHRNNDNYIITSLVDWADNDSQLSYEKGIKLEKIPHDNIVLKEQDKR